MKIDYEYLTRIRRSVALYTNRKTTNILEGDYHSIHRGRSMEFDDLKEYTQGDEVHDIDWKASSRMGNILVRRYMADRRHNVMFICDRGEKFLGDTDKNESKTELFLMTFGTIAYLVSKNGADFGMSYSKDGRTDISYFRSGTEHLEKLLYDFEKVVGENSGAGLDDTVRDVANSAKKRMIMFILTDIEGLSQLREDTIRGITKNHDLFIICFEDAYLTGDMVYDNDDHSYIDFFFSHNKALHEEEVRQRKEILEHASEVCKNSRACFTTISRQEDIVDRTVNLFERHRNGYFG